MEKFAVIITENIYHQGDERSRTNPGHGYPAWTEKVETLKEFQTEEEFQEWISDNNHKTYRAIRFVPVVISKKVTYTY